MTSNGNENVILKCKICNEHRSTTTNDWFVNTACGHVFHNSCIRRWIRENLGSRCPICKQAVELQKLTTIFGYDPSSRQLVIKIALLGDSGVGKTSLVKSFATGSRQIHNMTTTAADIFTRELEVDFEKVRLVMWDMVGQMDRCHAVLPQCMRGLHGVLFCYDPMHYQSLINVYQIWKYIATRHILNEKYVSILVECKNDMTVCACKEKGIFCRPVTRAEKTVALQLLGNETFSCSTISSDDDTLSAPFENIVRQILQTEDLMEAVLHSSKNHVIPDPIPDPKTKKCSC